LCTTTCVPHLIAITIISVKYRPLIALNATSLNRSEVARLRCEIIPEASTSKIFRCTCILATLRRRPRWRLVWHLSLTERNLRLGLATSTLPALHIESWLPRRTFAWGRWWNLLIAGAPRVVFHVASHSTIIPGVVDANGPHPRSTLKPIKYFEPCALLLFSTKFLAVRFFKVST